MPDIAPGPVAAVLSAQVQDAGPANPPPLQMRDAGISEQLQIQQTLRRWKEALLPLFRAERARAEKAPPALIAVSGAGATSSQTPPPVPPESKAVCEDGVQRLALSDQGSVDLVIAIDTSGSMMRELTDVVQWLATLELALRNKGVDFQMLVVADHRVLDRKNKAPENQPVQSDAGQVQLLIGSRDALETLITAAREGAAPRWHQLLRPGSTKHLIIVTDDEARDPRGLPYLAPLITAAEGALGTVATPAFTLHLLGGFYSSPADRVLPPQELLMQSVCPTGVKPGLGYQRLAQATGGLRASLCEVRALSSFTSELVGWPVKNASTPCMWLLPVQSTVSDVFAHHKQRSKVRLSEAHSADSCAIRNDVYQVAGQIFALCGATCSALTDAGYDAVEVSTRCQP